MTHYSPLPTPNNCFHFFFFFHRLTKRIMGYLIVSPYKTFLRALLANTTPHAHPVVSLFLIVKCIIPNH